ncbi:hypothetical protein Ddye_007007 [Dipteronia dyeriana]|uniref:Uncharacterized protein n=1 Tax=Dipteronia dyeriana TaxID=168575 RepID=A0AAE0CR90_9ROSI|nr:hypothetical protein Ddye_007007 [Dipteronia dyeriana]
MSIFKITVGIALRIEKLERSFLWSDGIKREKLHAVKWDTICSSKANDGLGIGRVAIKNKCMLAKWVWHYGNEHSSLWKQVIITRYGLDKKSLQWNWQGVNSLSFFVKAIASLFQPNSRSAEIIRSGLSVVIGNGVKVKFWTDIKMIP